MWLSFPASDFYSLHMTIIRGFDLTGSFKSISTVEDIQSYLTAAATMNHAFSPVSSTYLDDVQSKSFIDTPQTFPPIKQLGCAQFPTLTTSFTITVWIKTGQRLDAIIRKQVDNVICWRVGPEAVLFGAHDSYQLETVAHPWAQSIYQPGVEQTEVWKTSEIRRKVSDNQWHHLGFRVHMSNIDFVYDGKVEGSSPLSRPMTDCPGGNVVIGSERFVAEMSDLVFFNRFLNNEELEETFSIGRPIDVLLSGSGPRASTKEFTVQEQLTDINAVAARRIHDVEDNLQLGQRSAVLEMLKRVASTTTTTITTVTADDPSENVQQANLSEATLYMNDNSLSCRERTQKDAVRCFKNAESIIIDVIDKLTEFPSTSVTNYQWYVMVANCISLIERWTPSDIMEHDSTWFQNHFIACYEDKNLKSQFTVFCTLPRCTVFHKYFRNCVLLVEQENCRVDKAYQNDCPSTCGLPSSSSGPSRESMDQCVDTNTHRDSWDQDCAWYQLNDKNCERYASDETREHCQNTCGSNAINQKELARYNQLDDDFLNVQKLNTLLLSANQDHMLITRNMAHTYVAYYCCLQKHRDDLADAKWKTIYRDVSVFARTCYSIKPSRYNMYRGYILDGGLRPEMRVAFATDYPDCFTNAINEQNPLAKIGFPTKWLVENDANNIIAQIFKDAVFGTVSREEPRLVTMRLPVPLQTRTVDSTVQLFARDSVLTDAFSLTSENREWRWEKCSNHSDCTDLAFACQPDHYDMGMCKDLWDNGLPPQKQFCSLTCFTGGCDHDENNKVCQPCDACVEDTCTDACHEVANTRDVTLDITSYKANLRIFKENLKKYKDKVDNWKTTEVHTNTYSISAWVKDFSYQRLFEKRVNVTLPRGYVNSEGYNAATGTLSCYWLSYSEFCFRTHWYDKKMTCIPNSLSSVLQDDAWHHLVVVKSAVEEEPEEVPRDSHGLRMKKRLDDFKFFVDGKQSRSVQFESASGRSTSIPPYAASDCGGPMVSTVEITHARDDATFGKDGTAFAHQLQHYTRTELIHLLPLGGSSTAVLRFVGLGVPKHAVIKDAYLELSAVQSPVQQAIERVMCGTRMGNNSSTEPINLRIFSPRVDVLQHPCSPYHEESACTEKGCRWVEGQCTSGVFGRPCSPWKGANAMLNSDAIRHTFVGWDIDTNNWRRTNLRAATIVENGKSVAHGAFESPAYDTATETGSVRISPDVSAIVKDILARDSYDPKDSVATFALQGPDVSSNKFFFTCDSETDYLLDAESDDDEEMDTCAKLQHLSDRIDARFPLFALSKDGATKVESGSAPRLRVYWCHTEDCISPTFAGAGDDVKWGKLGFTVPPSHPDLGPPPRVEDPKISAPATPIYNGIPYMVFGASTTGDQDPVSEGKMFDLRTMPKAMTLGEAQKAYYSNIKSVPNLPGPERTIDAQSEQSQLDVSAYSKEVFSIAPPILLQRRNLGVPCRELVPALGSAMTQYFNMQIDKQCMNGPYTCNFPNKGHNNTHNVNGESGFSCVDRNQYLTLDQYFGRKSVTFKQKHFFFPEFLEVMNLRTVYRNDKMLATRSWVDLESSTIVLISVFLAVNDRIGTVMQLKFENRGAGHVKASYFLSSFKQMPPSEQTLWIILACAVWICCFIEMGLIISSVIVRLREKKQWQILAMNNSKKRTEEMVETYPTLDAHELELILQEESQRLQRRMKLIANNTLIIDFWDVFDVVLRLIIFSSAVACVVTSFSAALHSSDPLERLGYMEGYMKDILLLPWHSESIQYAKKVQNFVDLIANIVIQVEYLREMRVFNAVLILLCLFRLIVYMRVHPKVAILYKTIAASVDDLFHFALTFSFLYFVLAFVATWTFGAIDERFATFGASCYEQFNMIIGEFPMDPVAELQGLYIAYLFVFCVLMFLIVMNFFLAIIIDSYSAVKDQVDECTVSKNFVADVYHTFAFYYYRWKGNWPSRKELIKIILRADMNHNLIHDQELAVPVTPKCLVANYIFPDLDSATSFVTYYLRISHNLAGSKKRDKSHGSLLEHHLVLKRLLQLDLLSDDWHGLHREVHPLGRRVDETKMLIRQLMRTGQKILNALRINKTQFARDQLLQDGDMADEMTVGKRNTKGLKDSINVETANSFSLPSQSIESRTSMASNQAP
eukprot:GEMP01000223.1.p1 GENE.GEMP01000223.1~~GEMP01000223.1.p1  ORF type:complete len:2246 (+),score=320.59 GEMP01000223.1:335-6739(+)